MTCLEWGPNWIYPNKKSFIWCFEKCFPTHAKVFLCSNLADLWTDCTMQKTFWHFWNKSIFLWFCFIASFPVEKYGNYKTRIVPFKKSNFQANFHVLQEVYFYFFLKILKMQRIPLTLKLSNYQSTFFAKKIFSSNWISKLMKFLKNTRKHLQSV